MFGYVTPCKMELKVKDYEKFKAYYCGLCKTIKSNFGNIPRLTLNYDMTFLAVLLDSLEDKKCSFARSRCLLHPVESKVVIVENSALKFASFCNVTLAYYKLLDNVEDDNSTISKVFSKMLNMYMNKQSKIFKEMKTVLGIKLKDLSFLEAHAENKTLDEITHAFADLTGYLLTFYIRFVIECEDASLQESLYWLGYNLGRWIYIIDAFDDLEKDMKKNKFNPINAVLNKNKDAFEKFKPDIENRVEFILVSAAGSCLDRVSEIPLKKNEDIINNILQFGLMEKMNKTFRRSEFDNEKSL